MKRLTRFLIFTLLAGMLGFSCTSQKELTYLNNLDTTSISQFFPMERPEYRVQYQDILYVNFFTMNDEMNTLLNPSMQISSGQIFREESGMFIYGYTVSDSGFISLPIIGDIYVYGKTLNHIKSTIQKKASEFLKNPTINVRLLSFKVSVLGEVRRPGTYVNYNNQLTVLEAIAMGGDITDYGNRKKVIVLRPSVEGTQVYRINLQDKNLLQSEGYFLLPNDIVVVEPIKSKPFQLNLPTTSLLITTTISTISTLILLLSFLNTNN